MVPSRRCATEMMYGHIPCWRAWRIVLGEILAMARSLCLLGNVLAQQAVWAEDQDEDEDREGEDILVFRTRRSGRKDREVGAGKGFEHAKDNAAQQRAGKIADAPQHGGGKCLQARVEAYEGINTCEFEGEEQ